MKIGGETIITIILILLGFAWGVFNTITFYALAGNGITQEISLLYKSTILLPAYLGSLTIDLLNIHSPWFLAMFFILSLIYGIIILLILRVILTKTYKFIRR